MSTEIILYSGLAIAFFYIINWFGRHISGSGYMSLSLFYKADEAPIFNNLFRIVAPVVLLLITSAILAKMGLKDFINNIWVVVPLMFVFRTLYNVLIQRGALINWKLYILNAMISILLSYWLYRGLIVTEQYYFPDMQSFANEFWLLIVLFVYQTFNSVSYNSESSLLRKNNYIRNQYQLVNSKYGAIIKEKSSSQEIEILCYAIITVEMFNRSSLHRFMERIYVKISSSDVSMGIMQVKSKQVISDMESVSMGVDILNEDFRKVEDASEKNVPRYYTPGTDTYKERLLSRTTWLFNNSDDYVRDVMEAYRILKSMFYVPVKKEKNIYNAFSNYDED